VNLLDAREKLAAALAPQADEDPAVLVSLVDSIHPPALMIGWNDPWLDAAQTPCLATGHLMITAVAARFMPGDGVAVLEELVTYVQRRLRADSGVWPLDAVSGPRVFVMAQTNYLAVHISVHVTVST
jgi:hypothetical protein